MEIYVVLGIILLPPIIYYSSIIILSVNGIYKKTKVPGSYNVEESEFENVKEIDYDLFEDIREALEKEGFVKSGDYISYNDNAKMYSRIFKNFSKGIRFQLAQAVTAKGGAVTMSLRTNYKDGKGVVTGSMMAPSGFKNAGVKIYKHIVNTPEEILDMHKKHVKECARGRKVTIDKLQLDDKEYMKNENEELFESQKKYGIMKFYKAEGCYRFTLYGAARAAIRHLFYRWFTRPEVERSETRFKMQTAAVKSEKVKLQDYLTFVFGAIFIYGFIMVLIDRTDLRSAYSMIAIGILGFINVKIIRRDSNAE